MIGVTGGLGLSWDRKTQSVLFLGLVWALALGLAPASAFAADPSTAQYESNLTQLPQSGGGDPAGGGGGGGGEGGLVGSLPFTGLDVAVLAAVAVVLVVAGMVLRRGRAREVDA